jgi:hypothetical protein
MYLPRTLYEALPYAYLIAGLAACGASYYMAASGLSDAAFAAGAIGIVAGIVLILRRRSYRSDAERYDRHSLDD